MNSSSNMDGTFRIPANRKRPTNRMKTMTVDCSECGRKRLCVLLQVCIPYDDEDLPKEDSGHFHLSRVCGEDGDDGALDR